jgi:purine-binding chemotaxis protein CheW
MSSEPGSPAVAPDSATVSSEPLLAFADALLSASGSQQTGAPSEVRQYVSFFLGDTEYAIPILQCREIVRISTITRVPEAPAHVRGVVNLRGHIVPAVDTRHRLGVEASPLTAKARLIVVEVAGRLFALIVDRVARILKLATSDIALVAEGTAPPGTTGVVRVGEAVVYLTDADRVLRVGAAGPGPTRKGEEA